MHKLDIIREEVGVPFIVSSGYRDKTHPIEAKKETPGTHAQGIAADIKVTDGRQRFKIVEEAIKMGFSGVGVASSFVHVDIRDLDGNESPVMWTY